ncbi:pentapeptide repeat-containing protein [Nocardia sp. NPDC050712]|uniref:pentapeptide repeat-containing protein n=1 Tax=Nocardia sp. NPDC050712 TaxID=3155518 RepID=UPI0033C59E7C
MSSQRPPAHGKTAERPRNRLDGKRVGYHVERVGLPGAVISALTGGLIVACIAYWFLRLFTPVDTSKPAAQIDLTRIALTVVAGVGGVVALVIAYRRQRDLEQSRFVERFGASAAQLGATDVAVRIAGVYAMAGVADESDGQRRQQCIDVLCGYLRLPYIPDLGGNHQTKRTCKRVVGDQGEDEDHFEYRQNDYEVRATIVRVIADHLRIITENSWSTSNFDFRTAYLEDADLSGVVFAGTTRFGRARFGGSTDFRGATFDHDVDFGEATFLDKVRFTAATFNGATNFARTSFLNTAEFRTDVESAGVTAFNGSVRFDDAHFHGEIDARDVRFGAEVEFGRTVFDADARFKCAIFEGPTSFAGALFDESASAWFNPVKFEVAATFEEASFHGGTWFGGTEFFGAASFSYTEFHGNVSFEGVYFAEQPAFTGASRPPNAEPGQWPPTSRPSGATGNSTA